MPKVGKETIHYRERKKHWAVDLYYNRSTQFYFKIPDELTGMVESISSEQRKERRIFLDQYDNWIVDGSTESELIKNATEAFKFLFNTTAKERDVIVILFSDENNMTFGSHQYNKEHPLLSIRMGITYCKEYDVNGEKSYIMTDEDFPSRNKKISIMGGYSSVINDTPENREIVEKVYEALIKTGRKLDEVLKDENEIKKLAGISGLLTEPKK